ncbi:MAG: DUF3302 domain-containing protein [Gemmatimonadales bacterium]
MSELVGFQLDGWDYLTFGALLLCMVIFVGFLIWLAGLPGRIAIARKHPDAEAVMVMGYLGFVPIVPWIHAFIWAFKPTDIVDIRRYPAAEATAIDEEIARLSGRTTTTRSENPPPVSPEHGDTQ